MRLLRKGLLRRKAHARSRDSLFARGPGHLDEHGDGLPLVQREKKRPHAGKSAHGTALPAVRAESRRISDPDQPPHSCGPDGVSRATRPGAKPPASAGTAINVARGADAALL